MSNLNEKTKLLIITLVFYVCILFTITEKTREDEENMDMYKLVNYISNTPIKTGLSIASQTHFITQTNKCSNYNHNPLYFKYFPVKYS